MLGEKKEKIELLKKLLDLLLQKADPWIVTNAELTFMKNAFKYTLVRVVSFLRIYNLLGIENWPIFKKFGRQFKIQEVIIWELFTCHKFRLKIEISKNTSTKAKNKWKREHHPFLTPVGYYRHNANVSKLCGGYFFCKAVVDKIKTRGALRGRKPAAPPPSRTLLKSALYSVCQRVIYTK